MVERPYELLTESLSGCPLGAPLLVASSSATAATPVHVMTIADVVDCVWLMAHNNTAGSLLLNVVLQPVDDTDAGDVAAVTLTFTVPRNATLPIFEGERVRLGTAAYTIGAYVGATDVDDISLRGWYTRSGQEAVTA